MSVYWINCFLACTLSYIVGHYVATRKWQATMVAVLSRGVTAEVKSAVTKDINIH
jgi:hypothetical protein